MSLWGLPELALNVYFLLFEFIFIIFIELLSTTNYEPFLEFTTIYTLNSFQNFNHIKNTSKLIRIRAEKRIGPHNKDILSIIFGSLLGDGHAERRSKGNGTRITFYQEGNHVSYLLWLHNLVANLSYCSLNIPKIHTRLGHKGNVRKIIRFRTLSYYSLNWVHDLWYVNKVKIVPSIIGEYLTPLALAIWIMDDGSKAGSGIKLCTNSFTYTDCMLLVKVLYENFKLKATVQSAGVSNQYHIYIFKESMPLLREIVIHYVHSSMKYKLN
jgi:ubiquinol-cytochrome c reductase cytochrome b subunit